MYVCMYVCRLLNGPALEKVGTGTVLKKYHPKHPGKSSVENHTWQAGKCSSMDHQVMVVCSCEHHLRQM